MGGGTEADAGRRRAKSVPRALLLVERSFVSPDISSLKFSLSSFVERLFERLLERLLDLLG